MKHIYSTEKAKFTPATSKDAEFLYNICFKLVGRALKPLNTDQVKVVSYPLFGIASNHLFSVGIDFTHPENNRTISVLVPFDPYFSEEFLGVMADQVGSSKKQKISFEYCELCSTKEKREQLNSAYLKVLKKYIFDTFAAELTPAHIDHINNVQEVLNEEV